MTTMQSALNELAHSQVQPRPQRRQRCALLALTLAAIAGAAFTYAHLQMPPALPPSPAAAVAATVANPYAAIAKGRIDIEGGVVRLAARRDGLVQAVFVEEGERVPAGRMLAQLDDREARLNAEVAQKLAAEARAAVLVLQARLTLAQREAQRLALLVEREVVARARAEDAQQNVAILQAEIDQARAAAAVAAARQQAAEHEIEQRTVRAPVAGVIARRHARPGDGVSTLNVTPLFTFVPDQPRIVRAELDEQFAGRIQPGMVADVIFDADETQRFAARVLRLSQTFGARTPTDDPTERADQRVLEVVLTLDRPDLLIGQRVLVKVRAAA